ncbi:MAG: aminotransferase class V-fold PLP-dependent enzyme [Pseudomonadota bacterium]
MAKDTDDHDAAALESRIASGLHFADAETGAVMPPIHLATTYARDADYALPDPGVGYSRDENPTYRVPEHMLAELEAGADALLFASGMAAATAVFRALTPGDRVVVPDVMYWGLRHWIETFAETWGLERVTYVTSDPDSLAQGITPGTRLVWVETPSNPLWDTTDLARAAALARAAGAMLAVDSTVATPVHTQPIQLGADIVMHSATKALNGHSDVLAGALVCRERNAFWERIATERGEGGAVCGAFEAWLLQRGMRTLFLRQRRASENAQAIAEVLQAHPNVERVRYPGLADDPGHAVAAQQMRDGFGSMLSFMVRGGRDAALAVAARLRLFARATSLGGVESLVEHRATIEGPDSPIPDNLLRLSVGIEVADDLIVDLAQALDALD